MYPEAIIYHGAHLPWQASKRSTPNFIGGRNLVSILKKVFVFLLCFKIKLVLLPNGWDIFCWQIAKSWSWIIERRFISLVYIIKALQSCMSLSKGNVKVFSLSLQSSSMVFSFVLTFYVLYSSRYLLSFSFLFKFFIPLLI